MTKQPSTTLLPATILAAALVVLSGCGQSGPLQLPQGEPRPVPVPVEGDTEAAAAEAAAVDAIDATDAPAPDAPAPDASAPDSPPSTHPSK